MNITGFNPNQGGPNTQVTINLTEMPADAVRDNTFALLSGDSVDVVSVTVNPNGSGTVTASIEENSQSGEFVVMVQSAQGLADAQSAGVFTVNRPAGEPIFQNMNPRQGMPGITQVTLSGQNLNEVQFVRVGNTAVMNIQHTGNTMIRFTIPASAQAGSVRVSGNSQEYGRVNVPFMLNIVAQAQAGIG